MIPPSSFYCGCVEGFYGRPWTTAQRKNLFALMRRLKLNTYMYAPKDDCKHRMYWREMYSVEEAEHLTGLIDAAKENNVDFVYALSPGLDVTFSSAKEVTCLKRKLEQVRQFGCEAFSLLFDDIDTDMCAADKEVFQTFAHAQVSVTNEVFQHLGQPKFLFCPTEYCATRAEPSVRKSEYLRTLGAKLLPDIKIMWTGPKVVSKTISVESILELTEVIKRKPVIWDNVHANDYDQQRIFLGPFKGRSSELHSYVSGILTNPNCEYEANYIALHTLATWSHCCDGDPDESKEEPSGSPSDNPTITAEIKLETEGDIESVPPHRNYPNHGQYDPDLALKAAVTEWMEVIMTVLPGNEKRLLAPPLVTVPPTAPPIPSINTCMSITTPTTSSSKDMPSPGEGQLAEELLKNKEAFDTLAAVSAAAENFKPIPNPVNSLVSNAFAPGDPLEPMDCNGDFSSRKETVPSCVVPTKMSSNVSTTTTTVCKVSEVAMQIDETVEKESEGNHAQPENTSNSHSKTPEVEAMAETMTDTDTEMQSDGADADSQPEDVNIESAEPDSDIPDEDSDSDKRTKKLAATEKITVEDVLLLVELFYLPYEHGSRAVKMLEEIHWLKTNAHHICEAKLKSNPSDTAGEWADRAASFVDFSRQVHQVMMRLLNIPNRSLLYDLYPYMWDMEGVISTLASFVKWLDLGKVPRIGCCFMDYHPSWCSKGYKEAFMSGDLEPWVFRGGLTAEFQRMLPLNGAADLFSKKPYLVSSKVYTIRPFLPADEDAVYRVCLLTCADGGDGSGLYPDHPQLIGDRLAGTFLTFSREYCFVLCDRDDIVGYALAAFNAKNFNKQVQVAWLEEMKRKYPKPSETKKPTQAQKTILSFHEDPVPLTESLFSRFPSQLRLDVLPCVEDTGVVKNMLACVLSALKTSGSHGAFVEVSTANKGHTEFYNKLGFVDVSDSGGNPDEVAILGRII
ncbi:protein O-GlcNAcase-like isoform X2 [Patiria miniata]|uniref:protein O-GlcNAcase n=1 Tax=Patiria miniata TaxID=46514 RepID=A0A914AQQ1_PATMI|nr:protein O-GlcNAcase-like isoform X2 [Patiria miniata]